jgi:hypothetical protein
MFDLIVFEEQFSKYLIVVNNRIIVHRTLYKKGQCIKISNVENNLDNSPFNIKNYVTNDVLIVNHIELNSDVETSNNIKSIFISNEGYISNQKDIILPIDHDNNNIVYQLIPKNSFIIRMYNHDWYKIVSQAMIDSLLRQYNYDSIMSNFLFVDSSDDNTINSELSRRNLYNKNIIDYNNKRRVQNMSVDTVEAVSSNNYHILYLINVQIIN